MEAEAMEEMELEPAVQEHANTSHSEDWRKALSRVVPAVVVLRTTATRTFDTEVAGSGYATGFVVDKRRGILLTNRHVIEPGPIVAEAVFVNRDEIPVYPLYRDPIHDFGFLRFDPAQFSEYEEIPLAPAAAVVGLEIRVVGNDSGGKVSILAGTLARLDRDAPFYKKYGYNDFNTFYIQAASGTKGGSSGSPVIDIHGRAVALNAGGHKSSSALAYYLPLERVVRALHLLQAQKDELSLKPGWAPPVIPRGTFQMTLSHIGFDEIRRLGLKRATEKMVRRVSPSSETGMLVVESVVPGGPAFENQLEPGDVLVRAGGEVLTQFLKYESLLDDNVGSPVSLEFERRGTPMTVTITVQDLHSITPNKFLEVSGGVIHAFSYQQARNFHVPCGLVYVAKPGYMFSRAGVPKHAIIKNIAGEETVDIAAFISVFFKFAKGARVPLEFVSHVDKHRRKSVFVTIDRHEWYAPPQIYTRNDAIGLWDIQLVERTPLNAQPMELADGKVLSGKSKWKKMLQSSILKVTETFERVSSVIAERAIKPCLVMIDVHIPKSAWLDGVHASLFSGTGVIVHHSKDLGLVAIDKYTAAISASDVVLSFAAFPIEIPGQIVFSHPVHNYAFVAYNPTALGKVGIKEVHAAILSPNPPLPRGYTVNLVGLSRTMGAKSRRSTVTNPSAHLTVASALRYYRSMNTEVIELGTDLGHAYSGVLADRNGNVRALWSSFSTQGTNGEDCRCMRGIPIHAICKVLDAVVNALGPSLVMQKSMPVMRILEVEFDPTLLSKARSFGLTDKWIHVLGEKDSTRRQVLRVKGCLAGSRAHGVLNEGDMLLAISGKPVTCFRDVEIACGDSETLDLRLFRQGREINIEVGLDERDGFGTTHMLSWAGCVLQEPHSAVRALGFLPPQGRGVYMGRWCRGSPSQRYGLNALKWIVEVNGKPTPNLEDFVDVARELEHDAFVHVKMLHLNGKPKVLTMKQDLHYWPTWELRLNPSTALWSRHVIKAH